MKRKRIYILSDWEGIKIENANVDICLTIEEDFSFNLTQMTLKNIEKTVQDYAEYNNGSWLQLYHFANDIDKTLFHQVPTKSENDPRRKVEQLLAYP